MVSFPVTIHGDRMAGAAKDLLVPGVSIPTHSTSGWMGNHIIITVEYILEHIWWILIFIIFNFLGWRIPTRLQVDNTSDYWLELRGKFFHFSKGNQKHFGQSFEFERIYHFSEALRPLHYTYLGKSVQNTFYMDKSK